MAADLPTNPQALALWLLKNLQGVERVAGTTLWGGQLPSALDFADVERHLEAVSEDLKGVCNLGTRRIEFYPSLIGVYEDMAEMLGVAANRYRAPDQFVIRSLDFKYPDDSQGNSIPAEVSGYFEVIGLWATLCQLADLPGSTGNHALFVAGHNERVTVHADYQVQQLSGDSTLASFAADFSPSSIHADQKRSIVRATIIETFKPRKDVAFGDILEQFRAIDDEVRKSYSMYMAEFSVKKVMGEVERQNLEDTLSLNKTLSDIQNHLLALPAAILLAGATLRVGEPIRNYAVLAGVFVFSVLMWILIGNQRHSVKAIAGHIALRKKKVTAMPDEARRDVLGLFRPLERRVTRQHVTLCVISLVVAAVLILSVGAVCGINGNEWLANWIR